MKKWTGTFGGLAATAEPGLCLRAKHPQTCRYLKVSFKDGGGLEIHIAHQDKPEQPFTEAIFWDAEDWPTERNAKRALYDLLVRQPLAHMNVEKVIAPPREPAVAPF